MKIFEVDVEYEEYRTKKIVSEKFLFVMERWTKDATAVYVYGGYENSFPKGEFKAGKTLFVDGENKKGAAEVAEYMNRHGKSAGFRIEARDSFPDGFVPVVPKEYAGYDSLEKVVEIDPILDEKIAETVRRRTSSRPSPIVVVGENRKKVRRRGNHSNETYEKLWCSECGTTYFPNEDDVGYGLYMSRRKDCPNCRNSFQATTGNPANAIESADYREAIERRENRSSWSKNPLSVSNEVLYVRKDGEDGISIYRIARTFRANAGELVESFDVRYVVRHSPGGEISSSKKLKSGMKKVSPFEALHVNSKTVAKPDPIIYEGYESFLDFAKDSEPFLRKSGFLEVSRNMSGLGNEDSFFMLFVALMNEHPVLEQIAKAGYSTLFREAWRRIVKAENADEIRETAEALSKLVDDDETSGRKAMRIPSYVGEYLRAKGATIDEYYAWRDAWELTRISKERFEEATNSLEYALVVPRCGMETLANILKFGYPLTKLLRYVVSESATTSDFMDTTSILADYLNMCDLLEVKPDLYPVNLRSAHDRVATAFRRKTGSDSASAKLARIARAATAYVNPPENRLDAVGIPKEFKTHVVVFPSSVEDFVDEGSQQHNCVGSYPSAVESGKSVVFFIRKKDSPKESYVTGECVRNGLGQLYFSNNRSVSDSKTRKFALYVANRILEGCRSGAIPGLMSV